MSPIARWFQHRGWPRGWHRARIAVTPGCMTYAIDDTGRVVGTDPLAPADFATCHPFWQSACEKGMELLP
ncbi:MAG TPA: hypothetical protein VLX92_08135 [Kofleriaceae bacterium]|nr:hypothetical protein [Kofleriaceae bacterium]